MARRARIGLGYCLIRRIIRGRQLRAMFTGARRRACAVCKKSGSAALWVMAQIRCGGRTWIRGRSLRTTLFCGRVDLAGMLCVCSCWAPRVLGSHGRCVHSSVVFEIVFGPPTTRKRQRFSSEVRGRRWWRSLGRSAPSASETCVYWQLPRGARRFN